MFEYRLASHNRPSRVTRKYSIDGTIWRFNLKIKNYTARGTYEVSMVSGDSDEYVIDPTCTGSFVID